MGVYLLDDPRKGLPVKSVTASTELVFVIAAFGLLVAFLFGALAFMRDPATIGGHAVPGDLSCEKDEVITFDRNADEVPYPLACVHIDAVR